VGREYPRWLSVASSAASKSHLIQGQIRAIADGAPDLVLRDEPGSSQFEALLSRDDETKAPPYEVYSDEAAFAARRNRPSVARSREGSARMVVRTEGNEGRVVPQFE
jgi:quinol monooxygenase YgiN